MNEAEPELGLGTVEQVDERTVVVAFPAAEETRRYALSSAPLRRVRFAPGDRVTESGGETFAVDAVDEHEGLLVYRCGNRSIPETRISDRVALGGPEARLLAGRVDSPQMFDLRAESLVRLSAARRCTVRGFLGSRIELLPHQFFIASEVTGRRAPRVLLADETGLGKTIEACLIANRLLLTGRASRILILVPDSLVHQWLVELRRRFNLRFAIFDEERCTAAEDSGRDDDGSPGNPFESEQLVLAGIGLVAESPDRARQAAAAGWDLCIVDEAHHLGWKPGDVSPEYGAIETVTAAAEGLLLLTATPEQLGEHGHFARLRLLDPDRYSTFDDWHEEAEKYRAVARLGARLLGTADLLNADYRTLAEIFEQTTATIRERTADPATRHQMFQELTDRHGPGRVIFRNTRRAMRRFPERAVQLHPLAGTGRRAASIREVAADLGLVAEISTFDFSEDVRVEWLLARFVGTTHEKTLIVCRSAAKVRAIKDAIDRRMKIDIALFHEDLSVLQRDRNAAWFADPSGAAVLICSEIGSEGRNFQHAHHLVMFDLPLDPDLVEQRIGRLDRIGRVGTVNIHLPFVEGSAAEVLIRWLREGVGVFERPVVVGHALLEQFGSRVATLVCDETGSNATELDHLIDDTAAAAHELSARLEAGRDRLLEMASLRRDVANELIQAIREQDDDTGIDDFFLRLMEHFHVYAEQIGPRTYLLNPDTIRSAEFPGLADGDTAATLDRDTALVREDLEFLSWDHPMLDDAMELMQSSEHGNASFALLDGGPPGLFLESTFVLETVAPNRLHADRFLPPTPVRATSDQRAEPADDPREDDRQYDAGDADWIVAHQATLRALLAKMAETNERTAELRAKRMRESALERLHEVLGGEIERLRDLAKRNDGVRPREILDAENEIAELRDFINNSRIRLDACRLIWRGPSERGVPAL